jgi:hypothetical protein
VPGAPITTVSVCLIERHSREWLGRRSTPGHAPTMRRDPKPSIRQEIVSITPTSAHNGSSQYQAIQGSTPAAAPSTAAAATSVGHHHHGIGSAAATPSAAATTANSVASAVGTLIGSIINTVA